MPWPCRGSSAGLLRRRPVRADAIASFHVSHAELNHACGEVGEVRRDDHPLGRPKRGLVAAREPSGCIAGRHWRRVQQIVDLNTEGISQCRCGVDSRRGTALFVADLSGYGYARPDGELFASQVAFLTEGASLAPRELGEASGFPSG